MRGWLTLCLLAAVGASGCDTVAPMPGTPLGTFKVTAAVTQNTCGTDLGAPDPWIFEAELSREDGSLHWRQNGLQIVSGTIDEKDRARIVSTQTGQVGQSEQSAGCRLGRTDTLDVMLGASDAPTTLVGQLSFSFTTDAAPACASQLQPSGGAYAALPCAIVYSLAGERSKAP